MSRSRIRYFKRRWPVLLPALALVVAAVWCLRLGVAGVSAGAADLYIKAWGRDDTPLKRSSWEAAQRSIERSLALDPDNPEWHETKGRLAEWAVIDRLPGISLDATLDQAATAYERAVRLRPTWPYTWLNLALVRMDRHGLNDPRAAQALERALTLGPWEPRVHYRAASLMMADWEHFDWPQQEMLMAAVQRGTRREHRYILDMANRSGRLLFLCDHLDLHEQAHQQCERYGWTPL